MFCHKIILLEKNMIRELLSISVSALEKNPDMLQNSGWKYCFVNINHFSNIIF